MIALPSPIDDAREQAVEAAQRLASTLDTLKAVVQEHGDQGDHEAAHDAGWHAMQSLRCLTDVGRYDEDDHDDEGEA